MEEIEICIPACNEEAIILPTLESILKLCDSRPDITWKVTVIDNGSIDSTAELVRAHEDVRVALLHQNIKGKGAALSLAAQKCTSGILVFVDADLSADPKHIFDLLREIEQGADIAIGSRLLDTQKVNRSIWRTATARIFKVYANIIVPLPVADSQCGLKMMNKKGIEILASCEDKGWFFDRELLAKAAKRNLTIVEVSVVWEEFRYPNRKSKLRVLQAGIKSLYSLWKVRESVGRFK